MTGLANEGEQEKAELLRIVRIGSMGAADSPLRNAVYEDAVSRLENQFDYPIRVSVAQPQPHTEG